MTPYREFCRSRLLSWIVCENIIRHFWRRTMVLCSNSAAGSVRFVNVGPFTSVKLAKSSYDLEKNYFYEGMTS